MHDQGDGWSRVRVHTVQGGGCGMRGTGRTYLHKRSSQHTTNFNLMCNSNEKVVDFMPPLGHLFRYLTLDMEKWI